MPKALDLQGKMFGYIEVLYKNGNDKNGKVLWHCKCHKCGNEKDITAQCLTRGETKSCGCDMHRLRTKHDLKGIIINSLTVKKYIGKSKWECECKCGNITVKSASDIVSGRAKSCGKCGKYNLSGKMFNNLEVIGYASDGNWRCRCRLCGNICKVKTYRLTSGKAVSCGCVNNGGAKLNLVGKRFGKLLVVDKSKSIDGRSMWKCLCDCGNEKVVSGKSLTSGNTKSCGCLKHEHNCVDLTGKEFGNLIVLSLDHVNGNKVFWKCYCKLCGSTKVVNGSDMKIGKICSCGCLNVSHKGSASENELRTFVSQYVHTTKERRILDGKEIDIYIPSLSIGIEYNGSKVHSSRNNPFSDKPSMYHRDKFNLAKEKGIHLITIFDVDWNNKKEKIKSYLKSLVCKNRVIMARKCEVVKIDCKTACEFVENHHIQGANKSAMKINYGLYIGNELYSVMSFGKLRLSKTCEGQFELHRYCVKDGYTVVGGANKLLKYFEKEYSPKHVLSYSDNDYFLGGIYERLGFTNTGQCKPRYYWYLCGAEVKRERCRISRLRCLNKELVDEAYRAGAKNKEDFVMTKLGACKVYRSGNTRWEKKYDS